MKLRTYWQLKTPRIDIWRVIFVMRGHIQCFSSCFLIEKGIITVKRDIFNVLILLSKIGSETYFQFRHFWKIETCIFTNRNLNFFQTPSPWGIFPKFLRFLSDISPNEVYGCRYSLNLGKKNSNVPLVNYIRSLLRLLDTLAVFFIRNDLFGTMIEFFPAGWLIP